MQDKIQDKRKRLYDGLVAAGYDAGADFKDFNNLMDSDEVARRWVYDTAKSEGWNVGESFDQFVGYITPTPQSAFSAPQMGDSSWDTYGNYDYAKMKPKEERDEYVSTTEEQRRTEIPQYHSVTDSLDVYKSPGAMSQEEYSRHLDDMFDGKRVADNKSPRFMNEAETAQMLDDKFKDMRKFGELKGNQGITVGRKDIIENNGRFYTPVGSYDSYEEAAHYIDANNLSKEDKEVQKAARKDIENDYYREQLGGLYENIKGLKDKQRVYDIQERNKYREERSFGQAVKDAVMGIPVAEMQHLQGMIPSSGYDISAKGRFAKEQNDALTAAGRLYNEAQAIMQAAKGGNFIDGLNKALGSIDTWSSQQQARDNIAVANVVGKWEEGKALTEAEQALLESLAVKTAINNEYQDEISNWYKAGEMVGEMAPFMVEMMVNPLSGLSKKAATKFAKWATEKYGKKLAAKAAGAVGGLAGATAGGYGMALTTGLPSLGTGIQERMLGKTTYDFDKNGDIAYTGQAERKGLGESTFEELTAKAIDNATEMMGAGYVSSLGSKIAKTAKGKKLFGWINELADTKWGKSFDEFRKATKWNGPIEEFLEEIHAGIANTALVGDQSLKELFDKDNLATIAIGVAIPGVAISTAQIAGGIAEGAYKVGASDRRKMANAGNRGTEIWRAGGKLEQWQDFMNSAAFGSLENTDKLLTRIHNDNSLTNEEKMVAFDYAIHTLRLKTALGVKEAMNDGRKSAIDNMLSDIYSSALSEDPSASALVEAESKLAITEKAAKSALGLTDKSIEQEMGNRSIDEVALENEDLRRKLLDYFKAKAEDEGRRDAIEEMKQTRYAEVDRSIDNTANKDDGMVYSTTLPGGEKIFITGGKVVLDNEGYLDVNQSEELVGLFPDNSKKPIRTSELREKIEVSNAQEAKDARHAEIDAELSAPKNAFSVNAEDGTHTIEVVEDNGNGFFTIVDNGEQKIIDDAFLYEISGGRFGKPAEGVASVASENATETATEVPATDNVQTTVEPIPTETRGKVKRTAYHTVPIERTLEDLESNELTEDEKIQFTQANIDEINSELQKVLKQEPKMGADIQAYKAAKAQWTVARDEWQKRLDYYNELLNRLNEPAPVVNEVASAVEDVAPQATNEMQPVQETVAENQSGENNEMVEPVGNSEQLEMSVTDNQGNPIDENGRLIVEEVATIDDITDADFDAPARNVQLPALPENVATAIGTSGKPVVIKKNVFEKNGNTHVELEPADSREILKSALYNPNIVGATQPIKRPDYKVAIRTGEKNAVVVLDVFQSKDHVEIVGWRQVNEKGLAKMQRQAEREGGQFLILSPNDGSAAALSALPFGLSSVSKDRNIVSKEQENTQKSDENAENGGEKIYSQEELDEVKEQLGELNATSAPEFAARLFSIKPWKTLEEANAALKELLASYGETLNGQSLAVMPFLDKAQGLINEYNKIQEPRFVEETLENGDKRTTNYNSRGEVATVATERDGKVVSVDSYDEGVLFEHTEYDENGVSTSVTRYDKQGNPVVSGKTEQPETNDVKTKDVNNGADEVITQSDVAEMYNNIQPRDVVETTPDEFIALHLPKITPESFKRETGLKNDEQRKLVGVIAGADKGGVTIEQAAETILENYGDELQGLGFAGDVQEVRNTIIDILSSGSPRTYAKRGLEQRKQQSLDEQRAEIESVAVSLGFNSVEEWIAYEETFLPVKIEQFKDFDENEYYNNLAKNYKNDTTRESENTRGGSELLQGEQSADNGGERAVGERYEGTAVSGNVQGGNENGAPQGNHEEVISAENKNNVAEGGNAPGQSGVATTLIKGAKWENTGEPDKIKSSRKRGDSHDITWYIGKKKYGSTTAERDLLVILAEDYGGDLNAVWNAYEQGEVLLSANEAAILKKLIETNTSVAELQQGTLELDRENPAFERATENVRKKLEATGVKVKVLTKEEAESELARLKELADMQKRTAPETVSVQDEHLQTVVSSADGTKVLKDLDSAIKEYENDTKTKEKTFLGRVAEILNAKKHGSNSQYATFEAMNGKVFTIRLANHNAKVSTFDNHNEDEGISIVVTAQDNNGITNDGNAHLVEFFYDAIKLRKADGKPLVEILKSIKQALYSGEYKDNTGLAQPEEVNIPEFMKVLNENAKKTGLIGTHSLTEEKLRKAIKMGGLANPSTAIFEMGEEMPDEYGEITFVMPSSMVDKKTGRNTGAFAGDAWTPTYPQVERQMSKRGGYRAREDVQSVPKEMQKEVRMGLDSWLDGREGTGLAYMFLQEEGMAPELSRVAQKYPDEIRNRVSKIAQGEPFYRLSPEQKQQIVDLFVEQYFNGDMAYYSGYLKEKVAMLQDKIADENTKSFIKKSIQQYIDGVNEYGYEYEVVSGFLNKVQKDINHSGAVNDMATTQEAARIIREQGLEKEFQEWKEELIDRYEIKEVIFKGFTPTGNRKYVPHTLENVSKDMKEQGRNGAVGLNASFSKFAAGLLKPLNSLDAIRKRKGNLRPTHADTEAFKNKWSEVYYDLAEKLQPDAKGYEDYGLDRVAEAATKKDPKAFIKSEYGIELSETDEKALKDMIWAIQNEYPVMYFETKFERPVYLDEFAGVALPENVGKDIVEALNNAGVKIETYEPGNEKARMDAVKRLAAADNRIEFLRTSDGTTYGWAVNGEIYLTPEGLNPNTPIHEYTHLWAAALQKSNPKLWSEVVEAMKLSPAWNEVMADDNYTDIHGDENRVASEVLSRLSGNEGYRRYMEQAEEEIKREQNIGEKVRKKGALNFFKRIWNKFRNWLQSVFKSGKVKAGDSTEVKAEPWEVFVNKSLKDFDEGVNPDAKDSPLDWMFIGKKGAENLDKAEEATTRLDNLNVAREMETGGKDAKAIKLAIGWERGADKKWGAKVGEVTMPNLRENNTMHSVDVTPEMQESVMEGQTMFRVTQEALDVVNEFNTRNRNTARVIFADGEQDLREQLSAWDFTPEDIEGVMKSFRDGTLAEYYPEYDKVIIYKHSVSQKELNGYLWHENAHRAVEYLFSQEEMEEMFLDMAGDKIEAERARLLEAGYEEAEQAEEYIVRGIEEMYLKNPAFVEQNRFKAVEGAREGINRVIPKLKKIIDFIQNGNEEDSTRRGRVGSRLRRDKTEYQREDRSGDAVEMRNAGNKGGNAQEAATADDTRFRIEENSIDNVPTQPLTFTEKITNSVLEASARNKENLTQRSEALRAYGSNLANVLKLMQAQRVYDKSTVDTLMKMAKMYFKNAQLLGHITPYEAGRIMSVLHGAVGKRDVTNDANKLVGILVDAHSKELQGLLDKAAKTKAKKVNASGVEVIGSLDKMGQITLEAYNQGVELDEEAIEEKIVDAQNDTAHPEEAGARINGLMMALEYVTDIKQKQQEVKDLQKLLKEKARDAREGNMSRRAWMEFRRATEESIVEDKLGIIDSYHSLIYRMSTDISKASSRARAFQKSVIDHTREIQHFANSDMEGISDSAQGDVPTKHNNTILRGLLSPAPTFQYMLKEFGRKDVEGKGYLYDYYMGAVTKAYDREFNGRLNNTVLMEAKLKEFFGKKMKLADLYKYMRADGTTLSFKEGGEMREMEISQGQMLYIYMINKMADGKMKLAGMGITSDVVADMAEQLPKELVAFADWVQDDFLTKLREKYNVVHERMFGAPMAAIENYFPIKVNKRSIGSKEDISKDTENDKLSTMTGAIIKRTKNAAPIDLSVDALGVLLDHINEMEHWAAFAEFNRDVNTLVNYRHFKNQVMNTATFRYGSGKVLWDNFRKTAQVVSGTYRPEQNAIDKAVLNFSKGVTVSKIAFRGYTALKQTLSAPAFWSEASVGDLAFCYANPKGSCEWAMEYLPGFKERWLGRAMGNEKLLPQDSDWKIWRNKFVQGATRFGMTPNAAVDALTIATGARAVYLTKLEAFKKAGYTAERANEKALQAAAEAYNESQQSSMGAYISPVQASGTAISSIFTTFKNSNFGYTRKTAQSIANIAKHSQKGYKEEAIAYMTKKLMREGLTEEQARKFAQRRYKMSLYKDSANAALFGFGLNMLWQLGGYAIYLFAGDDDEKKEELVNEALIRGTLGSLDGVPLGESLANWATSSMMGENARFKAPRLIAVNDFENIVQIFNTDVVRGFNELINMFVAARVGVNPATFVDMAMALADVEEWSVEEIAMFAMKILNAPKSQLELLEVDKAMADGAQDATAIMKRYVEKRTKNQAPLLYGLYSEENLQKVQARNAERFDKMLDERLENVIEDDLAFKMYFNDADAETKAKFAGMREKFLKGNDKKFVKKELETIIDEMWFGKTPTMTVYYGMADENDISEDFELKQMLAELSPVRKMYITMPAGPEKGVYYTEHEKEIKLYNELNRRNNAIRKLKKEMQDMPHKNNDNMKAIRGLRTEAMNLIRDYNE